MAAGSIGYERWKSKQPGGEGTEENYLKAVADFEKTHKIIKAPPRMVPIPGGGFVSVENMSSAECAQLNQEFVKNVATNQ